MIPSAAANSQSKRPPPPPGLREGGSGATIVVLAEPLLLVMTASVPLKVAVADALAVPAVTALTFTVIAADAPLASEVMSQVAAVAVFVQAPPLTVALVTGAPVTVMVEETAPPSGPALAIVAVYWNTPPAVTGSAESATVTPRSATARTTKSRVAP